MNNLQDWERELLAAVEAGQVREIPASEDVSPQSGYTPCACRDCMDTTVSSDTMEPELCTECTDAGCVVGQSESDAYDCLRDDAYGDDWEMTQSAREVIAAVDAYDAYGEA